MYLYEYFTIGRTVWRSELYNMSIRAYEIYPILCQPMSDCNWKFNVVDIN